MNTKQRIFGLDIVRATAILLILFSHSSLLLFPTSNSILIEIIQFFGTIGVDIFFVLSGFLIGSIIIKLIENKQTKPRHFFYFWIRRWFRTLPNYFLILVVNILLLFLLYGSFSEHTWSYFLFLQNFNQAQPDFFTESWSLSIEEFSYIIGPLLILIVGSLTKGINRYTFLIVTFCVILTGIILRYNFHTNVSSLIVEEISWSKSLRKVVIYRIDCIYYGFIGAYFAYYLPKAWNKFKILSAFIGLIIFLFIHFYIFKTNLEPSVHSVFFNNFYLPLLAISILLFFPVFSTWRKGRICRRIITKISIWSYSIYLVNYSIVLLTFQFFINVDLLNVIEKGVLLLAFWIITFLLSILLYSQFEKPMMNFRDSKLITKWFK